MANVVKGLLRATELNFQQVRLRHRRVNFKTPRLPHQTRAIVETVCRPVLPVEWQNDPKTPPHMLCVPEAKIREQELLKETQVHPYEMLLAKEARNRLDHANWIAFFHKNPIDELEFMEMQVVLRRECSMKLYEYETKVIRKAVENTKWEPIMILFQSHTYFGIGDELKVVELLQCLRRIPKATLLGGIIDNRLMTRADLEYYASLPSIDVLRSQLVGVLNTAAQNLVQKLTTHQNILVSHLSSYQELLKSGKVNLDNSSSSSSESDSSDSDSDSDSNKKK